MPEITEDELPANIKPLWLKAIAAVQANNAGYAVSLIQGILEQSPGFLKGRKTLRKCELQINAGNKKKGGFFGGGMGGMKIQGQIKKNPQGAMALIEKELEKDPLNDHLNDQLFECALKLELHETAAFALETLRKGNPDNVKAMHKLAKFYLEQNQPDLATEVYNDIIEQDPTDGIAIKGSKDASARASMLKQKWDEKSDMKSLMRDKDQSEEMEKSSRTGLTREQLEARRDEAIEKYNQDQNNLANAKTLAAIYEQLEDWHNAKTFYEWAHSLSSGDVALETKASAMNDQAIKSDISALEAASQAEPENEELKEQLQARKVDRAKEQIHECQSRVDKNPTDPQLRYELGNALYLAGQHSEAIPHLQQATRNPHIRTKVLLTLGRCFRAKNMNDLAVKQLSDALADLQAMDGTKKEILYEKGLIHESMDDRQAALDSFKQIYEVDYGYRDVAQRVEASYS